MSKGVSNQNSNGPVYDPSSIYGHVKTKATPGGHIDEIDDTLGYEKRTRAHPNGTKEVWSNNGREITVFGSNFKAVIGDDTITVTGNVNITVNGTCNSVVKGDYNLTVLGNYNLAVKGNIVQKNDGTHVVETTNGDIIHNSGSFIQQHSVSDMVTKCGGSFDTTVSKNLNLNVNGNYETQVMGHNAVLSAGKGVFASNTSVQLLGSDCSVTARSGSIEVFSGSAINLTGSSVITEEDVIVGSGEISVINHVHKENDSITDPPENP